MDLRRALLMAAAHTEAEGQQLLEEALPDTQPHWDPNSGSRPGSFGRLSSAVVGRIKQGC